MINIDKRFEHEPLAGETAQELPELLSLNKFHTYRAQTCFWG